MSTRTGDWARLNEIAAVKVWLALLTQAGTDAPTASELRNNLGGTPVLARTGAGVYTLTLAGAFPAGKVFAPVVPIPGGGRLEIARTSANVLTLSAFDAAGAAADVFTGLPVRIEIYP